MELKIVSNQIFNLDETNKKALVIKHDKRTLFVLNDNIWKPATLQENKIYHKIFLKQLKDKMTILEKQKKTIGFMHEFNKTYIFKLKNMKDLKNTGRRCNTTKLNDVRNLCEELLNILKIPIPASKTKGLTPMEDLFKKTFSGCVLLEILLRRSHNEQHDKMFWFLDVFEPLTISEIINYMKKKQ